LPVQMCGDELLSDTRLSLEEYARIGTSHLFGLLHDSPESRAHADHARLASDKFSQLRVLLLLRCPPVHHRVVRKRRRSVMS
jgi:hypothetical protein